MKRILIGTLLFATLASCSRQQYVVSSIHADRYPVVMTDSLQPNDAVDNLIAKYKILLDKEMNQVIGESTQDMTYGKPQSLLTNLTSDVMLKAIQNSVDSDCEIGIMNVNGHRANLAKGNITIGNMFEIYSFENTLTIVKLKGSDLLETFNDYAKLGGYGISSSVQMLIKDKKIVDATVNGKPVDKDKIYTIVTLDYLAEGNDGMESLKKATEVIQTGLTLRSVMLDYVQEETKRGNKISSVIDERIVIE